MQQQSQSGGDAMRRATAISARSNRALSRFWAGILCITVLGVGVVDFSLGGAKAEKSARTDPAVALVRVVAQPEMAPGATQAGGHMRKKHFRAATQKAAGSG